MATHSHPQEDTLRQRLPVVIAVLAVVSLGLLGRLMSFQFQLDPRVASYLDSVSNSAYNRTLRLAGARGNIYDRDMQALAVNTLEYKIGISPNLVTDDVAVSTQLAGLLGLPELDVLEKVRQNVPWVLLAPRVSAEVGQQVAALDLLEVTIEPLARRSYPQGTLAAQVVGFVGGDLQGYYGVEGFYQDQLAGREREETISQIPFDVPQDQREDRGADLILTIDRDLQFLAESELQRAITQTGSSNGTIIVMNPRNGDVLAMASYPSFDPNAYFDVEDPSLLINPAISVQYEPGSVMKLLTMASAIDLGVVTPTDTYLDEGRSQWEASRSRTGTGRRMVWSI